MQIEPKPADVVLCTFDDTLRGWLAAWVVRGVAKAKNVPVQFETTIQRFSPSVDDLPSDERGRHWLLLAPGISYDPKLARSLLVFEQSDAASDDNVLPFASWEYIFPYGVKSLTRRGGAATCRSLSSIHLAVWDFFRPGVPVPHLFADVAGGSAAVTAAAETYDFDFRTVDALVTAAYDLNRRSIMETAGEAVLRDRKKRGA
jgi:hypothetical protein